MEAHRPIFERFLQALVEQPILKRSNLLYDFLTLSEGEWMDEADLGRIFDREIMKRQIPNIFQYYQIFLKTCPLLFWENYNIF